MTTRDRTNVGLIARCGRGWARTVHELPGCETDANRTGVAIVSVLFGLVVARVAEGFVELVRALLGTRSFEEASAGIAHHMVGFVLTITSFVGYFASKNGPQLKIKFFNFPLLQIILDCAMVVVYFFVPVYAENAGDDPTARPEAMLVSVAFGLYVAWDLVSWRLRGDGLSQLALGRNPEHGYGYRRIVTVVSLVASLAITARLFVGPEVQSFSFVIAWDGVLILLLFAYRVAKAAGDEEIKYRDDRPAPPRRRVHPRALLCSRDWERVVPVVVRNDIHLLTKIRSSEKGCRLEPTEGPAGERLRAAGAIEIGWDGEADVARLSNVGKAYLDLRPERS